MNPINRETHDFTPYRAPNIVHRTLKSREEKVPKGLEPHALLAPLIDRLARHHPDWMFVSLSATFSFGTTICSHYGVYHRNEYLGAIESGYRDYKTTIQIVGPRIDAETRRGKGMQTGDAKKALKIVNKYFMASTPDENLKSLHNGIANHINRRRADAQSMFQNNLRPLSEPIMAYVMENWEVVSEALRAKGLHVSSVDFKALYAQKQGMDEMEKGRINGHGYTVYIENGVYTVLGGPIPEHRFTQKYQSEELPPHIKSKIGMLKLLDEGAIVPGIGVRMAEDGFFIIGGVV